MKPSTLRIAVLGAPRSGKTWLATALAQALDGEPIRVTDGAPWLTQLDPPDANTDLTPWLHQHARSHDLTLLTGLDLPPDPSESRTVCEAFDARLRDALVGARIAHQVIYGRGRQRLENALLAVQRLPNAARRATQFGLQGGRVPWQCGNCSDPDCEHRLFTGLL